MVDISKMDEAERNLYVSAKQVQDSVFWKNMMLSLDGSIFQATGDCVRYTMEGDDRKAKMAAMKVEAYNWLLLQLNQATEQVEQMAEEGQES